MIVIRRIPILIFISILFFALLFIVNFVEILFKDEKTEIKFQFNIQIIAQLGPFQTWLLIEIRNILSDWFDMSTFNFMQFITKSFIDLNITIFGVFALIFNLLKLFIIYWGFQLIYDDVQWIFIGLFIIFDSLNLLIASIIFCILNYWYLNYSFTNHKNKVTNDQLISHTVDTNNLELDDDYTKQNYKNKSSDDCCICLEPMGNVQVMLDCKHAYHFDCIEKWFKNNSTAACPFCKREQANDIFSSDYLIFESNNDYNVELISINNNSNYEYNINLPVGYSDYNIDIDNQQEQGIS